MGYCFMTIGKIKDKGTMGIKYNHNYRKELVLNADPTLIDNNEELVALQNNQTYNEAWDERIQNLDYYKKGHKIRSNQVLAFEIVTTFSKEDADRIDIEKWKQDNLEWMKEIFDKDADKYGSNILGMISHEDEGNIHIHTIVTPVDPNGKLNAFYYTGGRQKMRALQDSYAAKMQQHGLKRGIKGSKATHQDIKRFYTALNQEFAKHLPEPKRFETTEQYKERVEEIYTQQNLKIFSLEKENERIKIERDSLANQYAIETKEAERNYERKYEQRIEKLQKQVGRRIDKIVEKVENWEAMDSLLKKMVDKKMEEDIRRRIKEEKERIRYEKEQQEMRDNYDRVR